MGYSRCCICGKPITGKVCSAWPFYPNYFYQACEHCHDTVIIPAVEEEEESFGEYMRQLEEETEETSCQQFIKDFAQDLEEADNYSFIRDKNSSSGSGIQDYKKMAEFLFNKGYKKE